MSEPFFTIKSPQGDLIHTHVSMDTERAIEDFMQTEETMWSLMNLARAARKLGPKPKPTWEDMQAHGYSVVPVRIEEVTHPLNKEEELWY